MIPSILLPVLFLWPDHYGRIYWHKPDKLPEKRSNGWEINGIPLKRRVVPEVRTVE